MATPANLILIVPAEVSVPSFEAIQAETTSLSYQHLNSEALRVSDTEESHLEEIVVSVLQTTEVAASTVQRYCYMQPLCLFPRTYLSRNWIPNEAANAEATQLLSEVDRASDTIDSVKDDAARTIQT